MSVACSPGASDAFLKRSRSLSKRQGAMPGNFAIGCTLTTRALISEQVAKSVINQHFKETGELPDGVDQVDGRTKFFVK